MNALEVDGAHQTPTAGAQLSWQETFRVRKDEWFLATGLRDQGEAPEARKGWSLPPEGAQHGSEGQPPLLEQLR